MFKTYSILVLFLCTSLLLRGQIHKWEEPLFMNFHLGGDSRSDIDLDSSGNIYLIGLFDEEVSILDTTLSSDEDNGVFIAKFDINHNLIWANVIAEAKESTAILTRVISHVSLEIDQSNNIIANITYRDSTYINDQFYDVIQSEAFPQDVALLKISNSGEVEDIYNFKGSCSNLISDYKRVNDNLYIHFGIRRDNLDTASTCSCILNNDTTIYLEESKAYFGQLDMNSGQVNWIKPYKTSNNSVGTGRIMITNSKVYLSGAILSSSDLIFDSDTLNIPNIYTCYGYLIQTDLQGNYQWARYFATKGWDSYIYPQDFILNTDNDIIITSNVRTQSVLNQVFFDNVPTLIGSTNNDENFFIINYDSLGNIKWYDISSSSGYDAINSINFDSHKNIYLTGRFNDELIFGMDTLLPYSFSDDILILSYDQMGNKRWAKKAGSFGNDVGIEILVDSLDNLHILGTVSNTATFGNYETTPLEPNFFLGKMTLNEPLNNINYTPKQFNTSLYPNPNSGICTIYTEEEDIQQINIYNSLGQLTQTFKYTNFTNTISISQLKPGIYIVELISKSGKQVTQKLIVE